jgi:hypothetical protein
MATVPRTDAHRNPPPHGTGAQTTDPSNTDTNKNGRPE